MENTQQLNPHSSNPMPVHLPPPAIKKHDNKLLITEHLLAPDQIKAKLATDFDSSKPNSSVGLTHEESKKRLSTYGPNILTPPKKTHAFVLYLHCLSQLFNVLLIVCAVFTWILYGMDPIGNSRNSFIGAILFGVALINAFIEFYQLQKSAALLASFMNMIPANCNVLRQGQLKSIPAMELVPGDIVFVKMGDKNPADIVVISSTDFKVDNSSLTGESEPLERTSKNTNENPLEATNLAFNGTLAVSGECYGVVIQTGDSTVLGQIANLTQGEAKRASPLSEEIERFVKIISAFAVSSALIFFVVAYFRSSDGAASTNVRVSFALNFAIGILVAWVPQGLPATVSMLLTIAAKRMSKKQVLVKDLQGVETLGAITLLATDKTGTLTRNQMTVSNIWTSLKLMVAGSSQNAAEGEIAFDANISGVEEITLISSLCSKARFISTGVPIPEREIMGDATESGLYRFAATKLSNAIDTLEETYPKVFEIPFNSDNKWHMSIHAKSHASGSLTQFMKGAPERVLRCCTKILIDGKIAPLTEGHKKAYTTAYETMAGKGHRVLAFAQNLLDGASFPKNFVFEKENKNYPTTELCFVGLASLEDPPKHGVREAIGHCREAGIKVMMVTGDHPLTAEAIGRKINMILSETKIEVAKRTGRAIEEIREDEYDAIVIHGEKIDDLTDDDWDAIFAKDEIIFARTSPKHKLQIVKRAQALGHIVGVTGDGVNDSPALKTADLGIAMNISGSDVSKEAASMILIDDNFASTVNGIAEGRLIFVNLKKCIQYVVTHIMPEVLPFLLNVIIPIPAALDALQILVVDLGFELFAALSYAWEPAESPSALMKVPPRRPVTQESVERLRRRKARVAAAELPHGQADPETGVVAKASLGKRIVHGIKAPFTKNFWIDRFEKPEGEILVDGSLLSWAYLEVGIIEFLGCMTAFFVVMWAGKNPRTNQPFRLTPYDTVQVQVEGGFGTTVPSGFIYTTTSGNTLTGADLTEAYHQAQSIYYLGIMIIQMFNLFACKCRMTIPFGKYPLSNNYTWGSVFAGAALAMFFVYVPPVNAVFVTSYHLSPLFWLIPFAFGWVVLFYAALRILWRRKFNPTQFNADIPNLQMFPTRWSTRRTNTK